MDGFIRPGFHGPITFSIPDPLVGPGSSSEILERARVRQLSEEMKYASIVDSYDGWICTSPEIGRSNGFFQSVGDCLTWCGENWIDPPEFAFCCDADVPHYIDYDDLVQEQVFVDSFEEAWEHVGSEAEDKFRKAIDDFNVHISSILTYSPDRRRKVRVKPL